MAELRWYIIIGYLSSNYGPLAIGTNRLLKDEDVVPMAYQVDDYLAQRKTPGPEAHDITCQVWSFMKGKGF